MNNSNPNEQRTTTAETQQEVCRLNCELKTFYLREKELNAEIARLQILVNQSRDGIVILDQNGKVFQANQRFASMLGYSIAEIYNLSVWDWESLIPRNTLYKMLESVDEHGDHFETRHKRKDGSFYDVDISTNGAVISGQKYIFCICRDISERKESEKRQHDLEQRLRQSQKMETIGTLAGGVAHDFNNILAVIIGNADMALDDIDDDNPSKWSLEEIRTAGLRARDIVSQLLAFSRNVDVHKQPLSLSQILQDAQRFLRHTIPATVSISLQINSTEDTVLADLSQMHQVIMNLSINAAQAMEQTGGRLILTLDRTVLTDDSQQVLDHQLAAGTYAQITVQDSGPGISSNILERIFEPYFTTKSVGEGTGMGLAVVHGIIKSHNGSVSVESFPGKGTTFSVMLPLTEQVSTANNTPVQQDHYNEQTPGTETILLVDDETAVLTLCKSMLKRLGYKVITASTPEEAMRLFEQHANDINLVLTDMTMPNMTGEALYQNLKQIRADIPVVLTTGHSALIDEEKARQLGLAGYLKKPFLRQDLSNCLSKILNPKG